MSAKQAQAILYGLALGDALGWPTEFIDLPAIKQKYGPQGIQVPPDPALYTDDTQMTIAVAEALAEAGDLDTNRLMAAVGRNFVSWLHSPENNRAPGRACMAGVGKYEQGVSWQQAGDPNSKGCGSAMRVALIGYFYQNDPERLVETAAASSQITHRHPAAIAASISAAYLVKLALDGIPPETYIGHISRLASGMSEDFDAALRRLGQVLGWGNEVAAMRHIGQGWVGEEAVALALYCVLRYPDDYVGGVVRAANSDGDSDSIACIAGGILGARLGLSAIPGAWRTRCENSAYLADLGDRIAYKRAQLG